MSTAGVDWLQALSWPCMVCLEWRPDEKISVARRPLAGLEHLFPSEVDFALRRFDGKIFCNVRYCNDRDDCARTANEPGPWTGSARDRCDPSRGLHVTPHINCPRKVDAR